MKLCQTLDIVETDTAAGETVPGWVKPACREAYSRHRAARMLLKDMRPTTQRDLIILEQLQKNEGAAHRALEECQARSPGQQRPTAEAGEKDFGAEEEEDAGNTEGAGREPARGEEESDPRLQTRAQRQRTPRTGRFRINEGRSDPRAAASGECSSVGGGVWKWFNGAEVVFHEDGTATAAHIKGVWKYLGDNRYEMRWGDGAYVDTVTLLDGGTRLEGVSRAGVKVTATRECGSAKR